MGKPLFKIDVESRGFKKLPPKFSALKPNLEDAMVDYVDRRANALIPQIRREIVRSGIGRRSGELDASWFKSDELDEPTTPGNRGVSVRSSAEHAGYLEEGRSGPWIIEPKRKKWLSWPETNAGRQMIFQPIGGGNATTRSLGPREAVFGDYGEFGLLYKNKDGKRYFFAKSVTHPGYRPYSYMDDALTSWIPYLRSNLRQPLREGIVKSGFAPAIEEA
jgi:hypothetical protein